MSCRAVRLFFCFLCSNMWLFQAWARINLPVAVTRIRLAIPFRVLILGTGRGSFWFRFFGGGLGVRGEDQEEVAALHDRSALDDRDVLRRVRHPIEDPSPDLLVDHLAAPEHDRHLDLLALLQKLLDALELGLEVMLGDFRPELHLLELGDVLAAPLVFLLLDRLELVLAVVDQAADGRLSLRRELDEVQALFRRDAFRGIQAEDSQLIALVVDQAHFRRADLIVDAKFLEGYRSLPRSSVSFVRFLQIQKTRTAKPVRLQKRTSSAWRLEVRDGPCFNVRNGTRG